LLYGNSTHEEVAGLGSAAGSFYGRPYSVPMVMVKIVSSEIDRRSTWPRYTPDCKCLLSLLDGALAAGISPAVTTRLIHRFEVFSTMKASSRIL
jgi:hypothetical protein